MVVVCFFGNMGELEFGGGNRLCDASVWDITLIPMSTFLMLSTLPSFKKQCVVVPVSVTSKKLVF